MARRTDPTAVPEETDPVATTKQMILATPPSGALVTGASLQISVQDVQLYAEHEYGAKVDANIREAAKTHKVATAAHTAAVAAYDAAADELTAPADFAADLKSVRDAVAKFYPDATIPKALRSARTRARTRAEDDEEEDLGTAYEDRADKVHVRPDRVVRQFEVVAAVTAGGSSLVSVTRDYPFPPALARLADEVDAASAAMAAAQARLTHLRDAKARVPQMGRAAAARVAAFNLQESAGGKKLLDALKAAIDRQAELDDLDVTLSPTATD